jgi:hypothetical protein
MNKQINQSSLICSCGTKELQYYHLNCAIWPSKVTWLCFAQQKKTITGYYLDISRTDNLINYPVVIIIGFMYDSSPSHLFSIKP